MAQRLKHQHEHIRMRSTVPPLTNLKRSAPIANGSGEHGKFRSDALICGRARASFTLELEGYRREQHLIAVSGRAALSFLHPDAVHECSADAGVTRR